jgi:hypothetical protein
MPGKRNAQYLVKLVRDHIQHQQQTPYRDGFAADANLAPPDSGPNTSTSILTWLNEAQNDLLETGYVKCPYQQTLVPGQAQYTLDQALHEIMHVTVQGRAMTHTTMLGLDTNLPGWQGYPSTPGVLSPVLLALPSTYYVLGDQIGFNPAPDQPYVVTIYADDTPADMVNPEDIPLRLPARFHPLLAIRAAWYITSMDIENDAAQKRLTGLDQTWQKGYTDLQRLIQDRSFDSDDQIGAADYRYYFRRGADG